MWLPRIVALALLASCSFDPAEAPDESPGLDGGAALDGAPDPNALEAYPASAATEAATAIRRWQRVACTSLGGEPCFDGRDREGQVVARVAVSTPARGPVELRITGASAARPPATVAIDVDGERAPADQLAVVREPVALGFVRDVVGQVAPPALAGPPRGDAEQRAHLTDLVCLARASARGDDGRACGRWQRDATGDGGLTVFVDDLPARRIVLVLRDDATGPVAQRRWRVPTAYRSAWSSFGVYQPAVWVPDGPLARWRGQAQRALTLAPSARVLLDRSLRLAAFRRAPLEVTVIGHRLGAAAAVLAGFDLHQRLAALQAGVAARYTVDVHGLDTPRISLRGLTGSLQAEYLRVLFTPDAPLRLHLFRRPGDPIEAFLGDADHPVSFEGADSANGSRTQRGRELTYCPVFTAVDAAATDPDPLAAWSDDLARMPPALVACAQPLR